VEGVYRQEAVQLCDNSGKEIAGGLVNYSSAELRQIQGVNPVRDAILGYAGAEIPPK